MRITCEGTIVSVSSLTVSITLPKFLGGSVGGSITLPRSMFGRHAIAGTPVKVALTLELEAEGGD